MVVFYEQYDRSKIPDIDSLLHNYTITVIREAMFAKYQDAPALL